MCLCVSGRGGMEGCGSRRRQGVAAHQTSLGPPIDHTHPTEAGAVWRPSSALARPSDVALPYSHRKTCYTPPCHLTHNIVQVYTLIASLQVTCPSFTSRAPFTSTSPCLNTAHAITHHDSHRGHVHPCPQVLYLNSEHNNAIGTGIMDT